MERLRSPVSAWARRLGRRCELRLAGAGMILLLVLTGWFHQSQEWSIASTRYQLFHWSAVGGLLIAYWRGYRAFSSLPDSAGRRAEVVGVAAAFCIIALFIPPFHSDDV